ncbi:MAG TPA: transposase [Ktedonobacteraceae bacterium]|nr:transposase [Ktedonobacteraceae bacterium]
MGAQDSLLVTLIKLVDRLPQPKLAGKHGRGRPQGSSNQLFLKALVIMIIRHLRTVHELLSVLAEPTPEMHLLRELLCEHGRFPTRRTWERRLKSLPETLPAQIGCLGRHLVGLIQPWATAGRAVAIESTVLRSRGAVWHQKHRKVGEVPHTLIDTEAHWTKSGWHGWVYGWKLHVVSGVAGVWFPLAALLTPANVADNTPAPTLLQEVPAEVRFVLGDRHSNTPEIREDCSLSDRLLVATQLGSSPHTDDGVEVRRVFHQLRSVAMENFNEHFKSIFDGHGQVPTKGLMATQRFVLGAVFVSQLALLHRWEHGLDLCVGLKAFLKGA